MNRFLLSCGILAALVYVGTDIVASALYPGFSFADQAVSELFAIGAPTSAFVVPLFSTSSVFLLLFALGLWRISYGGRAFRAMAMMFAASALTALVLWNVFPMHMRGAPAGFTDTMHLVLAANPFVLLAAAAAAAAFGNGFRIASLAVIAAVALPALYASHFTAALAAGQPTPGLGFAERTAQYAYQLWQIALAAMLIGRRPFRCRRRAGPA